MLLVGIIAGLGGWINQSYLKEQWNWYKIMRLYMVAQVRPYMLSPDAERALKPGNSFRECKDCPEMIVVPAGDFMMGSPANEEGRYDNEGPQHTVAISSLFAVSKFEVTFDEWDACVAYGDCEPRVSDSRWGRGRQPVINVTWDNAHRYVAWLSTMTGQRYRLLSEAEWEYVARAGTQTAYSWGGDWHGQRQLRQLRRPMGQEQTAPVGSFAANAFGLHDMHGNVWEWVADCYHVNYDGAPTDGSAWGNIWNCSDHVVRGGSWVNYPQELRSAHRSWITFGLRFNILGFRVGRTLTP